MLDDAELDIPQEPAPEPPRRSGNRSFFLVAGILGALMLLALIGLAVYALVILPQQQAEGPAPTLSNLQLTNTAIAHGLQVTNTPTRTATATRTPTTTNTPQPPTATDTPVTPLFSDTPASTQDPATQTVAALLTQAALAQTAAATGASASPTAGTPGTPTATASALPQSGFGDASNAPLLVFSALALFVIILLARRLRTAN